MILVYIENDGEKLPKASKSAIAAALAAKSAHGYSRVVGVVLGNEGVAKAATQAATCGLDGVCYVSSPALEPYVSLNHEAVMKQVIKKETPTMVLAAATARGKDLMPRLSQILDAGQASDVVEFLPEGLFRRPMYAGNVLAEVEITTPKKVVTVRSAAFDAVVEGESATTPEELSLQAESCEGVKFVSFDTVASERPELTEADVVISAGRAIKSAENFEKYIEPLADALGAAIGASRAAVDAGYAPNDWQVGQTGKVVAPELYIAIGISGAIQHLAGMKDSKVIVAINTDVEAPIFEVADYGLVADLFSVVPELTEAIAKVRA